MQVYRRKYPFSRCGTKFLKLSNSTETNIHVISDIGYIINDITPGEFEFMFYTTEELSKEVRICSHFNASELDEIFKNVKSSFPADDKGNLIARLSAHLKEGNYAPIAKEKAIQNNKEMKLSDLYFNKQFLDKFFPKADNVIYNSMRDSLEMQYLKSPKHWKILNLFIRSEAKEYLYFISEEKEIDNINTDVAELLAYILKLNCSRKEYILEFNALIKWMKKNI